MLKLNFRASLILIAAAACSGRDGSSSDTTTTVDVQTREVAYSQNGTQLQGYVAWNAAQQGKRPGVLVVHEWWGHNEHTRLQARRLAEAGYVAMAVDMYGNGKNTEHPDSATGMMMAVISDMPTLNARFNAALAQLRQDPNVDPERIAAVGYCFGGAVVLTQARAGADLDGVISVHGALPTFTPIDSGNIKARVLVLTGGADPMVPADSVTKFTDQMQKAGARIDVVTYPEAKHAFTNTRADSIEMQGLGYHAASDQQSFEAMVRFLREIFPG